MVDCVPWLLLLSYAIRRKNYANRRSSSNSSRHHIEQKIKAEQNVDRQSKAKLPIMFFAAITIPLVAVISERWRRMWHGVCHGAETKSAKGVKTIYIIRRCARVLVPSLHIHHALIMCPALKFCHFKLFSFSRKVKTRCEVPFNSIR